MIELLETLREYILDSAYTDWDRHTDIYICSESFSEAFETRSMFQYERNLIKQIDKQIDILNIVKLVGK